jgi:putative nucleotidyltransferase with HDIG domain
MTREEALALVEKNVAKKNLIKHMLAAEAAMKALALRLDEDPEKWALAGLLHDLDYDRTEHDFARHGNLSAEMLEAEGVEPDIVHAVKAHPAHESCPPESPMDWALHAVDGLTGLVISATLMHPDRKLKSLDMDFLIRRFDEKRFSANVDRDQIRKCAKIGIELEEFVEITLKAMQSIDSELGL